MEDNCLLTAEELGARLGVPKSSIYRMSAKNLIPSVPWGGKLGARRFLEGAVREALARQVQPPRPYHPPKGKERVLKGEVSCQE